MNEGDNKVNDSIIHAAVIACLGVASIVMVAVAVSSPEYLAETLTGLTALFTVLLAILKELRGECGE